MTKRSSQKDSVRAQQADVRKEAFLSSLRVMGNVTAAAATVEGLNRATVYKHWLPNDEAFKDAFDEAMAESFDRLEQEARRRAEQGVRRLKVSGGKVVTYTDAEGREVPYVEHEYSDTLMLALLRRHRPDLYSERHRVEGGDRPITFTLNFGDGPPVAPPKGEAP